MAAAIPVIMVVSAVMQIAAQRAQARAQSSYLSSQATAKQLEAEQYAIQSNQEMAAAERAAEEQRRQGRLMQSRAQAVAAASGDAGSPTVVNIISDLAGEAQYRAATAMYQGEERARLARMGQGASLYEAGNLRASSRSVQTAGQIQNVSTVFQTAASMYAGGMFGKYGLPSQTSFPNNFGVGSGPGRDY